MTRSGPARLHPSARRALLLLLPVLPLCLHVMWAGAAPLPGYPCEAPEPEAEAPSIRRVCCFADLDALLAPDGFAALIVASGDSSETSGLRERLLACIGDLERDIDGFACSVFEICPLDSGHVTVSEVLRVEPPAVTAIVGTCGFLNLETDLLEADLRDIYERWGAPDAARSSGICRFCDRCATTGPCTLREGE